MKNTNKTKRRVVGIVLSAVMLMSVAGATLCTVNAATADEALIPAQTQTANSTSKVERIDVVKINHGRVFAPGTSNWFAIRNTADGKKTYITASGEDGITTIELIKSYGEESIVIASKTADLSKTDMMKVEVPMNAEDGYNYFVNVYQNPETASTENYSVNHLSQIYVDITEATSLPFGETVTKQTEAFTVNCSDGTKTTVNQIVATFYITTGADANYTFDVSADDDLDYSFIVTDLEGNYVTEDSGFAKFGYVQEHSLDLDENGCYFIKICADMDKAGEATFTFGAK